MYVKVIPLQLIYSNYKLIFCAFLELFMKKMASDCILYGRGSVEFIELYECVVVVVVVEACI